MHVAFAILPIGEGAPGLHAVMRITSGHKGLIEYQCGIIEGAHRGPHIANPSRAHPWAADLPRRRQSLGPSTCGW